MKRARIAVTLSCWACFGGCSTNDTGIDVDLQQEIYTADFGNTSGTLAAVSCSTSGDSLCNQLPGVAVDVNGSGSATISVGCDTETGRCFAQANARVADSVDVQLDSGFLGKVEGRLIRFVRVLDLTYRVPANTLTFDVPKVDVYVGPAGTMRETDAGAVFVGSTPTIAAGATLSNGHLPIGESSGGHGVIQAAIRNREAFGFVLAFSPRITSGNPVPAGMIEVDLTPRLTVGF